MSEDLNQNPDAPENTEPEVTEAQGVDEGLAEADLAEDEGVDNNAAYEAENNIEAELAEVRAKMAGYLKELGVDA